MRRILFTMAWLLPLTASGQGSEDLEIIDAWLLGGSMNEQQKEAAVVKLINSKPAIAIDLLVRKGAKDERPRR